MKTFIKLLVSLTLLGIALYYLDWAGLKEALTKVNPWVFLLSSLIALFQFIFLALRWHLLVKNVSSRPLIENTRNYLYATFLNSFTPANFGGDVYRFFSLKDQNHDNLAVVVVLLKERILGILGFFAVYLVFLTGLWFAYAELPFDPGRFFFYAGVLILLLTICIFLSPYVLNMITKFKCIRSHTAFYKGFTSLHDAVHFDSMPHFAKLMGFSLLAVLIWILATQVVAVDLGISIPYLHLGIIVILVELVRLVPFTIQGIGLREGTYAYLFGMLGKSPEAGFILGTVIYLALSISLLIAGIVSWGLIGSYQLNKLIRS